ncbi:MAG TPA: hypothetical protein VKB46_16230 [Pyrinomonadaceae bacterium]|nr:hypothetical protein [Pyrinomonadaceae bacterium]
MSEPEWTAADTNTHQDHVIAHVIGATVLGHFVFDETAFLLLDIGFIWNIYLDGEMGLLPHPVAITELATDDLTKAELRADTDALMRQGVVEPLRHMTGSGITSPIETVGFFRCDQSRRLVLTCESGEIVIETSLTTGEVKLYEP